MLAIASSARAQPAPSDYRFEALDPVLERGAARPFRVQVVSARSNAPVAGVQFSELRMVRSSDTFPQARLPAFLTPSSDYAVYHFRADLPTDGDWAFLFQAQIPGEPGTVEGRVVLRAAGRAELQRRSRGR